MTAKSLNAHIANHYYSMYLGLPDGAKEILRIKLLGETGEQSGVLSFDDLAGAWEGEETAEELIAMIEGARYSDPGKKIEDF